MSKEGLEQKRPLAELVAWSNPLLIDKKPEKYRKEFIDIAATESPTKAFGRVKGLALFYGFSYPLADEIARAARWLAVIRRDYGQEEFDRITAGKG